MLEKLTSIQQREGWSDGEMARQIGVSRSAWNLMRRGHKRLTPATAIKAAGRFPELTRDLLDLVPSSTER